MRTITDATRWTALPNGSDGLHVIDIIVDRPEGEQAHALGHGPPFCTGINTVPAPRPTPALDALTRRLSAFPTFVALLTAAAGYRPSIRLDLLGREGLLLARAYDRTQAAWGDPRRASVTGRIPGRAAIRSPRRAEA